MTTKFNNLIYKLNKNKDKGKLCFLCECAYIKAYHKERDNKKTDLKKIGL